MSSPALSSLESSSEAEGDALNRAFRHPIFKRKGRSRGHGTKMKFREKLRDKIIRDNLSLMELFERSNSGYPTRNAG